MLHVPGVLRWRCLDKATTLRIWHHAILLERCLPRAICQTRSRRLGFNIENGESKSSLVTDAHGNQEWRISKNVLVTDVENSSVAQNSGLQDGDIVTEVIFGEKTYAASEYFNQDYELKDLLLTVSISQTTITLKVSRDGDLETILINLSSEYFVEVC